jgi:hypothetical protein
LVSKQYYPYFVSLSKIKILKIMQKNILFLFLTAALALSTYSCRKASQEVVTQTINANLDENGNYSFNIPTNLSDKPFEISTQASHYSLSQIATDATGNLAYIYTPSLNYTGTDQVIISTSDQNPNSPQLQFQPAPQPHQGNMAGGCANHNKKVVLTINLNIIGTSSPESAK